MNRTDALRILATSALQQAAAPADKIVVYEAILHLANGTELYEGAANALRALRLADEAQMKFTLLLEACSSK